MPPEEAARYRLDDCLGGTSSTIHQVSTGDRCYDFKNIFAEKISENIGVFGSNYRYVVVFAKNVIIILGFEKNANFFPPKIVKNRRKL
jgi:hypothetical protein